MWNTLSENEDLVYITLLDKKLKLVHIFPVVKVNIALYSVCGNNALQSIICETLEIL